MFMVDNPLSILSICTIFFGFQFVKGPEITGCSLSLVKRSDSLFTFESL